MNRKPTRTIITSCLAGVTVILTGLNCSSCKRDAQISESYANGISVADDVIDHITSPFEKDSDIHGNVNGNLYDNQVLQLSFQIPDNMYVLQTDEMKEYCESLDSYKRFVIDPDSPVIAMMSDEYYDLICTDNEGHIISILYVYYDDPNSTDNVDIHDYTINEITEESQKEFDSDPDISSATHDTPSYGFIDDQQVYLINWTIENSDGSLTYRTEIIDYSNPCIRVIAIEYDDPSEFDEISSGISYYGGNEEPNTQSTILSSN